VDFLDDIIAGYRVLSTCQFYRALFTLVLLKRAEDRMCTCLCFSSLVRVQHQAAEQRGEPAGGAGEQCVILKFKPYYVGKIYFLSQCQQQGAAVKDFYFGLDTACFVQVSPRVMIQLLHVSCFLAKREKGIEKTQITLE
jgi:hypothetical protein